MPRGYSRGAFSFMKNIARIILFFTSVLSALAGDPPAGRITVRVEGLKSADGSVRVAIFDSEQAYREKKPLREATLPVVSNRAEWVIEDLPEGTYSIRAYHDQNDNGKLDRTPVGIPEEPVGFSNNPRVRLGPPNYKDMQFRSEETSDLLITPQKMLMPGGQFGAGVALVYTESPYKGAGYQFWPFPSITYLGKRLSVFGPRVGYALYGTDNWSVGAAGQVRFRSLDPDDSEDLEGMEKRGLSFEAGLRGRVSAPHKIELGLSVLTDVTGEHNGQSAGLDLLRNFRFGQWVVSPAFGVLWQSSNLSDHYYGVRESEAREGRPEYAPGATWTCGPNLGLTCQVLDPWTITGSVGLEYLDEGITDSPIVGQHVLFRGFFGIVRQFGGKPVR